MKGTDRVRRRDSGLFNPDKVVRKLKRSRGTTGAPERILRFDLGRDPERPRLKYKAKAKDALGLFPRNRALFWEDWPRHSALDSAPLCRGLCAPRPA